MAQAQPSRPFANLNLKVIDRDYIEPKKMAIFLGISKEELAKILHKTARAVDSNPEAKDTQEKLRKLMYLTHLMKKYIQESYIKIWLQTLNEDFGHRTPLSVLEETSGDEDPINSLIHYIEDYSKGAPS